MDLQETFPIINGDTGELIGRFLLGEHGAMCGLYERLGYIVDAYERYLVIFQRQHELPDYYTVEGQKIRRQK